MSRYLKPPFQKVKPHPFVVANRMVRGSYVSCQSALAHYSLIPEHVPVVTSVTTSRPGRWETPLGIYEFRIFSKSRGKSRTLLRLDRQIQPPGDGFDNPSRAYTGTKLFLPQDIEKIPSFVTSKQICSVTIG